MSIKFRDKSKDNTPEREVYVPPMASEEEMDEFTADLPQEQKELLDLHALLKEIDPENAPLVSVLEAWKARHKSLYVSKISSEAQEFYVFTTIKRKDFKILKDQGVFDDEEKGHEVLVEKCLLYPAATTAWRLTSDAGIITTLGKQIAYKSAFVSPQEALSLIKIV